MQICSCYIMMEGGEEEDQKRGCVRTFHIYLGLSATRPVIFSTSGMNTALMKPGGRWREGWGAVRRRIRAELLH